MVKRSSFCDESECAKDQKGQFNNATLLIPHGLSGLLFGLSGEKEVNESCVICTNSITIRMVWRIPRKKRDFLVA